MARKRKKKEYIAGMEAHPNLPTVERMQKGGIRIRANAGSVDEPLRIDKLLKNGIIDEMQHLYGLQIITYWTIASRSFIRSASYEPRIGSLPVGLEWLNISRMGAEDKLYKTMSFLNGREREIISKICFEEMPAIAMGRKLGLPVNSITAYVRDAFDALGKALVKMREHKKQVEAQE